MAIIVIVDDDRHVRSSLENLLDSAGFTTRSFATGQALLEVQAWADADCLILDVRMRGMSGLELQQQLLMAGNAVPIIFLTAQGDDETRARAMTDGAYAFFSKPFDEEELLAAIEAAIRRRGTHDMTSA